MANILSAPLSRSSILSPTRLENRRDWLRRVTSNLQWHHDALLHPVPSLLCRHLAHLHPVLHRLHHPLLPTKTMSCPLKSPNAFQPTLRLLRHELHGVLMVRGSILKKRSRHWFLVSPRTRNVRFDQHVPEELSTAN